VVLIVSKKKLSVNSNHDTPFRTTRNIPLPSRLGHTQFGVLHRTWIWILVSWLGVPLMAAGIFARCHGKKAAAVCFA
jgi:hypothetical protein